jgi:hypothetical protein
MPCLLKWKLQLYQPGRADALFIEVETTAASIAQKDALFIEVDTTNVSTSQSGCIDY